MHDIMTHDMMTYMASVVATCQLICNTLHGTMINCVTYNCCWYFNGEHDINILSNLEYIKMLKCGV